MATGISFIFVLLDVGGCVLFLITLGTIFFGFRSESNGAHAIRNSAYREEYDWVAASNYLSVIVLDGGFVVVYYIYESWNGNSGLTRHDYLIQKAQKRDLEQQPQQQEVAPSLVDGQHVIQEPAQDRKSEGQRHRGRSKESLSGEETKAPANLFSISSSASSSQASIQVPSQGEFKSSENLVEQDKKQD